MMADSYLSIAAIADDEFITGRMAAAATQQQHLGSVDIGAQWGVAPGSAVSWVTDNRYLWASSPGWGAAWDSALVANSDPSYEPGKDTAVITDEMILSAVQTLAPPPPPPQPQPPAPVAAFTFTPASPSTGDTVTFDASTSTGDLASYAWDYGDGTTDNGVTVTHAYDTAGDYTVTLAVTDTHAAGDQTTQTITVT
jgi:PKD repeat protein